MVYAKAAYSKRMQHRWQLGCLHYSLSAALFAVWCATAVQQVAFADKLLLNKIDLVSEAEKKNVINRVKVGMCSARRSTCTGMLRCSGTIR